MQPRPSGLRLVAADEDTSGAAHYASYASSPALYDDYDAEALCPSCCRLL